MWNNLPLDIRQSPSLDVYSIYLVLGPLCKPLLVMELPNKRLLLLLDEFKSKLKNYDFDGRLI